MLDMNGEKRPEMSISLSSSIQCSYTNNCFVYIYSYIFTFFITWYPYIHSKAVSIILKHIHTMIDEMSYNIIFYTQKHLLSYQC